MSVTPDAFRQAMRNWTTGISILTAQYQGVRHGMTVSSFTSLALEPPMVAASIQKGTRTHILIEKSYNFGVTILHLDQEELSERFAGRIRDEEDRFVGLDTITLVTGAPFISSGLAFFDCKVACTVDLNSHTVFVGEVLAVQDQDGPPLVYHNRAYRKLQV